MLQFFQFVWLNGWLFDCYHGYTASLTEKLFLVKQDFWHKVNNNPIYLPWLTTSQHLIQHFHLHFNSEMTSQKCIEIYHILLSKSLIILIRINYIFLLHFRCQPRFLGIIHLKKSYVFIFEILCIFRVDVHNSVSGNVSHIFCNCSKTQQHVGDFRCN